MCLRRRGNCRMNPLLWFHAFCEQFGSYSGKMWCQISICFLAPIAWESFWHFWRRISYFSQSTFSLSFWDGLFSLPEAVRTTVSVVQCDLMQNISPSTNKALYNVQAGIFAGWEIVVKAFTEQQCAEDVSGLGETDACTLKNVRHWKANLCVHL